MLNLKNIQNFIFQIAESKGLTEEQVSEAVATALAIAYKKDYCHKDDRVEAVLRPKSGKVDFYLIKTVVDPAEVEAKTIKFNPRRQIVLEEARQINPQINLGDDLYLPLPSQERFSRIATQTAKQVINQKLREFERTVVYQLFKEKEGGVVTGKVQRVDSRAIYVDLGRTTGIMFRTEAIPNEVYRIGQRLRFYVYAIETGAGGVKVYLSRSHPLFIPAILKMEVPEIADGLIEVKGVARLPGVRTKVAIFSDINGIDAVGSCIGPRGARIISIMNEVNNERIDIIPWSDDPAEFIKNALLPANVQEVILYPKRTAKVIVTEEQLPIALGRNGQNIKLAANLTGWKIDVRLTNQPEIEVEGGIAGFEAEEPEDEGDAVDINLDSDKPVEVEVDELEPVQEANFNRDDEK
jgi:N utilization substance protein A